MTSTLFNGQPASTLSLNDRGLNYGDGLFETLRIEGGRPCLLRRHLDRLGRGMKQLGFESIQEITGCFESEIESLLADQKSERQVLKLLLTRGQGARGYRVTEALQPSRVLILSDYPDYPSAWYQQGISLFPCQTRLGNQPQLAGIKHLNRLENVLARNEWQDQYPEGLMRDQDGNLIEGTMTNLFLIQGDTLQTPALDRCGIAGIVREVIIEKARACGVGVDIGLVKDSDLHHCTGAFVCNSLMGVVPVQTIGDLSIPLSPMTQQAVSWLDEARQCEL